MRSVVAAGLFVDSTISGRIDQVHLVLELAGGARGGAARYQALDKWTAQLTNLHKALANKMA